jgi:hypothetical protein
LELHHLATAREIVKVISAQALRNDALMVAMKLVVQAQLLPDPEQDRKLRAVAGQFNAAADFAAGVAFAGRTANVL